MKDEHELHSLIWLQDKHSSEQWVHTPNLDEKTSFGKLHESNETDKFKIAKKNARA